MPSRRRLVTCALWALWALLACIVVGPTTTTAKEIEPLADTWTRIGENDTIPAGMHVKIDMTTGEKWVKQLDPVEQQQDHDPQNTGHVVISTQAETTATPPETKEPHYDYERMYHTLAQLPPEEHERMGGLPELPASSTQNLTPEQRKLFELRMKQIWEQRQAELQKFQQEQLLDLPQVLKNQITYLRDFINGQGDRSAEQIKNDLEDLEYLLTDVDMARDFHTLQGWPWLLSVLVQRNETAGVSSDLHDELQAAAAWVVGTAVQNTGEFRPFVVEPVMLSNGTVTSALDVLMDVWNNQITSTSKPVLPQKVLYALSACLRGNPLAQHIFHQNNQATRLEQDLRDTPTDTAHGRKQILRILQLGHDLLVEWQDALDSDETNDAASMAVIQQFRQAWVTPEWCHVVLDKARVVTRADKRLPIVDVWFSSCQNTWDPVRVNELLAVDDDVDADDDTKALHNHLSQKMAIVMEARQTG